MVKLPKKNTYNNSDKKVGSCLTQVKGVDTGTYVKSGKVLKHGESSEKLASKKAATLDAFRDAYDGHNKKH